MCCTEIPIAKKSKEFIVNPKQFTSASGIGATIQESYSFSLHKSIHQISDTWSDIAPDKLFFSVEFLSLIEDHPPAGLHQHYLIYSCEGKPVGGAVIQVKRINLNDSINFDVELANKNMIQKISGSLKSAISRKLERDTLICGNVLLTGEYGFYFKNGIPYSNQFEIVENSLKKASKQLKTLSYKIGPILLKDYYTDKSFEAQNITTSQFTQFAVQPNMIMEIDPEWKNFQDYLNSLKSKYRVRAKRALKKSKSIVKKELNLNDIKELNDRIYQLYLETAKVAGFNLFILPYKYFSYLKEYLNDKVKIVGYFIENELIGYYTIVYNKDFMEAHYLGYDKEKNANYQIYLNMLFDLLKEGILCETPKIQFARTALEIKSSVGAKPYNMFCYLKTNYSIANKFVPIVLNWFVPEVKWVERSPFKG